MPVEHSLPRRNRHQSVNQFPVLLISFRPLKSDGHRMLCPDLRLHLPKLVPAHLILALYWIYLSFSTQTEIIFDAIGYKIQWRMTSLCLSTFWMATASQLRV